ncbi:MAG: RpiB/LacA/LacB family sugar-phosphate isomerase [Bacilli bacterium]|nr:RpiB/LacA/LacB family sugar-phosphate isomerase [Bacilli bacterium]
MKIGIASDHRGYALKEQLASYLEEKYETKNYGTYGTESVDYPDYAFKLGEAIARKEVDTGIILCGTGIGVCIAANKVKGIRCAKVETVEEAKYAKMHNNANMLAFGENTSLEAAKEMIAMYLETPFSEDERHRRRVAKIDGYTNV